MTSHIEFLTIYVHKFDNDDRLSDDLLHKMSSKASTLWHNGGISTAHAHKLCTRNPGDAYYTPTGTMYCFQVVFHKFGVEDSHLMHHFEDKGIDDSLSHDIDKLLEIYDRQDKLSGFTYFTLAVSVSQHVIYGEYKDHFIEYDILGEVDFSRIDEIIVDGGKS